MNVDKLIENINEEDKELNELIVLMYEAKQLQSLWAYKAAMFCMLYGYETHQVEKLMKEKAPSVVGAEMVRRKPKDDV
jgi:hypothetical protein